VQVNIPTKLLTNSLNILYSNHRGMSIMPDEYSLFIRLIVLRVGVFILLMCTYLGIHSMNTPEI
jgi:hypothetical protein